MREHVAGLEDFLIGKSQYWRWFPTSGWNCELKLFRITQINLGVSVGSNLCLHSDEIRRFLETARQLRQHSKLAEADGQCLENNVFHSCDVWNVANVAQHSFGCNISEMFRMWLFHVVSCCFCGSKVWGQAKRPCSNKSSPKHCLLAPGTPNASSGSCKAGGVEGNLCALVGWAWDMEYSKYSMSCMWVVLHKITQDPSQFLCAIQECVCIYIVHIYSVYI